MISKMFLGESILFVEIQENKCSGILGNSNQAYTLKSIFKVVAICKLFNKERWLFFFLNISKTLLSGN